MTWRTCCRLDQFGEHTADIAWMQECDRCAKRAVPWSSIEQPDASRLDAFHGRFDVGHAVADVVHAFAPPLDELPDRRVRAERFEQLHVGDAWTWRVIGDREHRL